MATNKIILKKSSVSAKVPLAGDLDFGELALNYADGKLYYKKSDGTTIDAFVAAPAGVTSFNTRTGAITLNSSDVTSALGFTPLSNATSYLPLAGGTMTGAITFAGTQTWPTFNQNTTGSAATLTTGRTIGMTGDVTWTSGSFNGSGNVTGTATLANSGVTAGTYTKVTVDAKGRVTTGTSLASADLPTYTGTITSSQVTTALGYTPLSTSGGTISGTLNVTRIDGGTGQQLVLNAGEAGSGATGQTNEFVYINAESGLEINSSPDNWTSGWAGRNTATICGPTGTSTFPGTIIAPSVSTTLAGTTTVIANQAVVRATVATTTQTAVDTWAAATYRSAKYVVQITQGTNYQVSEILVIHNGTTATFTEYAVLTTGTALGSLTCDVSGGNVRLLVTMGSATSATLNISKTTTVV